MQQGMEDRSANLPESQRIRFRIRHKLGDIMVDEGDMFGDGVNLAARIEALAAPGETETASAPRCAIRSAKAADGVLPISASMGSRTSPGRCAFTGLKRAPNRTRPLLMIQQNALCACDRPSSR